MVTQTCNEVKPAPVAAKGKTHDLRSGPWPELREAGRREDRRSIERSTQGRQTRKDKKREKTKMSWLRDIWHRNAPTLVAENENSPACAAQVARARVAHLEEIRLASHVRALATGAALATSVDASPAVLVSMYDYAHRYDDGTFRRSA
jgi:hypothetical protein